MVLIALLLVAVVSLVLGLVLASTIWLVVSLVASGLAAVTLYVVVRTQRVAEVTPASRAGRGAHPGAPRRPACAARSAALVPAGRRVGRARGLRQR